MATAFFEREVSELIRRRTSWRSYEPRPLEPRPRQELEAFIRHHTEGPFGSPTRLGFIAASSADSDELRGLGTYGMIRNPAAFVVGAVWTGAPMGLEDLGYVMERAILRASDLELGTCWLGGSFSKSSFAARIQATQDELVPAVFCAGHPKARRGAVDRMVRWGAGSARRRDWASLFFLGEPGVALTREQAGAYAEPLEALRLAPSASNRQPWRVVRAPDCPTYHFCLRRIPSYDRNLKMLGLADLPRVDLGIAMCHFELSAREAGLDGAWSTDPPLNPPQLPPETTHIASWIGCWTFSCVLHYAPRRDYRN